MTKRLQNKGRQPTHDLTAIGRIRILRRWWHSPRTGSVAPADELVNRSGRTVTNAVREMADRLNNDSVSFDRAAENLFRTAQIKISGEQLRQIVLEDGARIRAAQEAGTLDPAFTAADCLADPAQPDGPVDNSTK